ncbi:MAG: ATP-binding protein [Candidatus Falkowbacteria bacterium]
MFMLITMICAGILDLVLAIIVWKKGRKILLNRIFIMMAFFMAIWIFVNFLFQLTYNLSIVIHFYSIGALIISSILLFTYCFVDGGLTKKNSILIMLLGVAFFILSYIDGLVIASVESAYETGYDAHPGPLFSAFGLFLVVVVLLIIYKFLANYKKFNDEKKSQAKYIAGGIAAHGAFTSAVSFILPYFGIWSFTSLDTVSSLFFTVGITYAITKHHLMNIKVIATELLVGLVSFVLFVDVLLAEGISSILLKLAILLSFIYLGWSMIQSVLREIHKRKELEDLTLKLERANVQLKKLDEAKSEFISIASHQLRTPLTVIKGYLSMILEGSFGKASKGVIDSLEKTQQSNERLISLVENLLNVSRIESGRLKFNFEEINIEETVKSVINELKIKAKEKNLEFNYIGPNIELPKVNVDEEKIRQVIMNLFDNSIKYTDKGKIIIELKQKDKEIYFCVADTGMGIEKDDLPNLFKKFSRGKETSKRHTEGTGLGLFVGQKMINAHKGKIWAESKGKNKGSKFCFTIPCVKLKKKK